MRGSHEPSGDESTGTDEARRSFLRTVGAGTALAALGGVGSATVAGGGTPPAREQVRALQENGENGDGGVDPAFGFPALSGDTGAPVEADHEVQLRIQPREGAEIPEFFFDPTGLYVEPGDTVKFVWATPHHTVTAYHPAFGYLQRVPDGVPPFSSPALPGGGYWLYTFDQPGVYEMHCTPHEIFGHVFRLVVGEPGGPGAQPLPDLCAGAPPSGDEDGEDGEGGEGGGPPAPAPPRLTAYTVLRDPALHPQNIVEQGRVVWSDLDAGSKQLFVEVTGFPPCGQGGGGNGANGDGAGGDGTDGNGGDEGGGGPGDGGNGKAKDGA